MQNITAGGVGLRFLFALVLVLTTFNPSGYSYFHWLVDTITTPTPWLALAGIVLIIGWVIYIRASLRSLGPVGLGLASIVVAVILWVFIDIGIMNIDSPSAFTWMVEIFVAAILCLGMSWSHVRRRMSGQADVDDI
jgi:energy-converting hydrogenase Eha subunit A